MPTIHCVQAYGRNNGTRTTAGFAWNGRTEELDAFINEILNTTQAASHTGGTANGIHRLQEQPNDDDGTAFAHIGHWTGNGEWGLTVRDEWDDVRRLKPRCARQRRTIADWLTKLLQQRSTGATATAPATG